MALAPQENKLSAQEKAQLSIQSPRVAGIGKFALYLQANMGQIRNVAAKHMNPDRLYRIVLACVTRTPALAECTMESILRASGQAAELGLEPGSALGECYLVPYNKNIGTKANPQWVKEAQFQPGYRGLISLAFRSGFVKSVRSKVVYQGDKFDYKDGLVLHIEHIPSFDSSREVKDITFFYNVIELKDGGVLADVMTRAEVEAIRKRSKSGEDGPWVTDYAEMGKKTVCKRNMKYAPMSVEMSKALAADVAAETGDPSMLAEFEFIEPPVEDPGPTKTETVRDKIPAIAPEGSWPNPVFGAHDAKFQALGMDHKEASDWAAAGVTEGQAKLALNSKTLEGVREMLNQAVNK